MFTHKITQKSETNGILSLTIEFTNGTLTFSEVVKPQDLEGFKYWVNNRLTSLNSLTTLNTMAVVGSPVDVSAPAPVDNRTAAEITKDEWMVKYNKWVKIKTTLIDTGVLTGLEQPVVDYRNDVKAGFKPAYINFL